MQFLFLVGTLLMSPNLIECEVDGGSYLTGCYVRGDVLGADQPFESTFSVDYTLECFGGNHLGLRFATEAGEVAVPWGIRRGQVQVTGTRGLRLEAADPVALFRAYVGRPCVFEVNAVSAAPSPATLLAWNVEGRMLAELTGQALELWKLAGSLEHILQWDDEQLAALREPIKRDLEVYLLAQGVPLAECLNNDGTLRPRAALPDGWGRAARAHPVMIDLVTILDYIEATVRGRPPVTPGQVVTEAALRSGCTLRAYYYERLQEVRRTAAGFLERLKQAQKSVDAQLLANLREIDVQLGRRGLSAVGAYVAHGVAP